MPAPNPSTDPLAARLVAIREATGLRQTDFVVQLNRVARGLYGRGVRRYRQPTVSNLECGHQAVSLMDVAVYAAMDPKKRGKLWVGWGERPR